MGFTGNAFGILAAEHTNVAYLLRLVAKRVVMTHKDGTTTSADTPAAIVALCPHERLPDSVASVDVTHYDDLVREDEEGPYAATDDGTYELEHSVWRLKREPGVAVGCPTSCGLMVYVAYLGECGYGDEDLTSPAALLALVSWREELVAQGRLDAACPIGIFANCCS